MASPWPSAAFKVKVGHTPPDALPTFTLNAADGQGNAITPLAVFSGKSTPPRATWTAADGSGGSSFSAAVSNPLSLGTHVLDAYPVEGDAGTPTLDAGTPRMGDVSAYLFFFVAAVVLTAGVLSGLPGRRRTACPVGCSGHREDLLGANGDERGLRRARVYQRGHGERLLVHRRGHKPGGSGGDHHLPTRATCLIITFVATVALTDSSMQLVACRTATSVSWSSSPPGSGGAGSPPPATYRFGLCRMCPLFRTTGDELASSRAKMNVLRFWSSGRLREGDFDSPEFRQFLDLCINCKACSVECPSGVDVSKIIAAARAEYVRRKGLR